MEAVKPVQGDRERRPRADEEHLRVRRLQSRGDLPHASEAGGWVGRRGGGGYAVRWSIVVLCSQTRMDTGEVTQMHYPSSCTLGVANGLTRTLTLTLYKLNMGMDALYQRTNEPGFRGQR